MTASLADDSAAADKSNWLLRYIGVQQIYDKKIQTALNNAAEDAAAAASKLDSPLIGARTKRYQSALVRSEIKKVIKDFYTGIVPIISDGQQDAAEAAAQAALKQDAKVLKSLFPNSSDRNKWKASFLQSARHGIAAMVTRISVSQIPLSQRVYRTTAFSTGLLDRRINSALSRGASAKEIANSVKDLIKPDTPGGVSYAAMRLGRSEINNAFHAMSINAAQQFPWTEYVEWNLSKSHKENPGDLCEVYADQKEFDVNDIPLKPHPQCMCFIVPKTMEFSSFAEQLQAGAFDDFFTQKYQMPAA